MEVILREDVQHLGAAGDVVKVKDGYARNYLLPQGKAYPATDANKKKIAYEADRLAKQRATEKATAETEATRLAGVQLSFAAKDNWTPARRVASVSAVAFSVARCLARRSAS